MAALNDDGKRYEKVLKKREHGDRGADDEDSDDDDDDDDSDEEGNYYSQRVSQTSVAPGSANMTVSFSMVAVRRRQKCS